jgi:O-antigen/teichoic acid export membrane protein
VSEAEVELHASKTIAFNAVVRAAGEILAKLASVVFFLAVARELGAGRFGDLVFALSFTTVMTLPSGFGTEELIARDVARDRDRVHEYASNVMAVKLGLTVVFLALAELIVILLDYSSEVQWVVLIVGAAVGIENLGRTWGAVLQAYQRMEFISASLIVQRVSTAVAGVAVLLAGGGLIAVSFVMLVSAVIGFAVATFAMQRFVIKLRWDVDRSRWRGLIRAGVPIGAVGVLMIALVKIDQTLISFFSDAGNREVGFYGAAFRLIEATMFIGWSASAALLPWFAAHKGGRAQLATGFELGTKAVAGVLVPVGLIFVLFAEPMIELLYGSRYTAAAGPLRFLGAVVVFVGINNLAASLLIARERPLAFARNVGVVLMLNIALNAVLIPEYGASGAAFTAALSSLVLLALGFVLVRTLTGRVRLLRMLGAPFAAGAAMAALVLLAGLPAVPEALLGGLAYLAAFFAFERRVFPDDFRAFVGLVRRRGSTGGDGPGVAAATAARVAES